MSRPEEWALDGEMDWCCVICLARLTLIQPAWVVTCMACLWTMPVEDFKRHNYDFPGSFVDVHDRERVLAQQNAAPADPDWADNDDAPF